jgi:cytochrome c556
MPSPYAPRPLPLALALALPLALALAACGAPVRNNSLEEIPKLAKLSELMDNAATTADPQFKKVGQATFTDEELAALVTTGERVAVIAARVKELSKGPEFTALASKLETKAKALGVAAGTKDAIGTAAALKDMKFTCKECHAKFK